MDLAARRVFRVAKLAAVGIGAAAGVLVILGWLFIAFAPDR